MKKATQVKESAQMKVLDISELEKPSLDIEKEVK